MAVRAPVTPEVMRWARETARLSIQEAAKKIGRPETDIQAWEDGSLQPTMPQARNAAHVYKRPLAVFYLPEHPEGWQVLRDFRTLPADELREYSSEFSFLMRETVSRQEWMHDFLMEEGQDKLPYVGSADTDWDPVRLASTIREKIGISPEELRRCRTRYDALNLWIYKAEQIGVFVFRKSNIASLEARGFVLCDEYAPFIFLNSSDAKVAQIFTLVHEFIHLWINEPGISNLETRGSATDKQSAEIETFCNRVTGLVVLEPSAFDQKWRERNTSKSITDTIERLASHFKISREVVARRFLDKGILSDENYKTLRSQYNEEWLERRERERERQRRSEGGPSPYRILLMHNGKEYSRIILSAYFSGAISGRETSSLLNVKLNNVQKFADEAGIFSGIHKGEISS